MTMLTSDVLDSWESALMSRSLDYDLFDPEGRGMFRHSVERLSRSTSCVLLRELAEYFGHPGTIPGNAPRTSYQRYVADAYIARYCEEAGR